MANATQSPSYMPGQTANDATNGMQQQSTGDLTKMNEELNGSVNDMLGIKSLEQYADDGMGLMACTTSSLKDAVFGAPRGQSALDSHDTHSNQNNQAIMDAAKEAIKTFADDPEMLACLA